MSTAVIPPSSAASSIGRPRRRRRCRRRSWCPARAGTSSRGSRASAAPRPVLRGEGVGHRTSEGRGATRASRGLAARHRGRVERGARAALACRAGRAGPERRRWRRVSTTAPARITTTRVADLADHAEVVGDEHVGQMPVSAWISRSRSSTCACTDTSSALVASSHTSRSGLLARARAMPMRCRWPPENSGGWRCSALAGRPTRSISRRPPRARSVLRPHAADRERLGDDVGGGQVRVQRAVRVLEHHLDAGAAAGAAAVRRQLAMSVPSSRIRPDGGLDQPDERAGDRGLAAAGFADDGQRLARSTAKLTWSTARNVAAGHRVVDDEILDVQERLRSCRCLLGPRCSRRGCGTRRAAACACSPRRGCRPASSTSAGLSTNRPSFMTWIRSDTSRATPRSWVIMRMPMPVRSCSSRSRSRIPAWTVTSSAEVGSSATSRTGSPASAMAIRTRCSMPPDSWCGYFRSCASGFGMCTCSSSSTARAVACAAARSAPLQADRLPQLATDGVHGAQRGHRVLRDERRPSVRGSSRAACGVGDDVHALEPGRAGQHGEVVGQQAAGCPSRWSTCRSPTRR